jgi:hypothetical protein
MNLFRAACILGMGMAVVACGGDDEDDESSAGGTGGTGGTTAEGGSGGTTAEGGSGGTTAEGGSGGGTAGSAGEAGSGGETSNCFGDGEPCGECAAEHCCPELTACAEDPDCQGATICLATCDTSFDECFTSCNDPANAAFQAYAACLGENGCGPYCFGLF